VGAHRLDEQRLDVLARVEARHRVLEDHLHAPAGPAQLLALERRQVDPVEAHRAGGRLDEAQDRPAERRLAAARLADEPERRPAPDVEVDAVDGPHVADRALQDDARADREVHLEPADLEQDVAARPVRPSRPRCSSTPVMRPLLRAAPGARSAAGGGALVVERQLEVGRQAVLLARRQRGAKAQPLGPRAACRTPCRGSA
jgi:hypothetical protein